MGAPVGCPVGEVGTPVGCALGSPLGAIEGSDEGEMLGAVVGELRRVIWRMRWLILSATRAFIWFGTRETPVGHQKRALVPVPSEFPAVPVVELPRGDNQSREIDREYATTLSRHHHEGTIGGEIQASRIG